MKIPEIDIKEYQYYLPAERIAQYPLPERDASKLLCFDGKEITGEYFRDIASQIPAESLMIFNDTKVIRARLQFRKSTGANIEILCLEPMEPAREAEQAFLQTGYCSWKCLIGNARRWKSEELELLIGSAGNPVLLKAVSRKSLGRGTFQVWFEWEPQDITFGEVLEMSGQIPLPPYIHRQTEPDDQVRYQTVYAKHKGSVAAPTAGLHFTEPVFHALRQRGVRSEKVILHVGLGTFRPVTETDIRQHTMHQEEIVVNKSTIHKLILSSGKPVIAVGTTSVRTLESLYWLGVKLMSSPGMQELNLDQWDPYLLPATREISVNESLERLLLFMNEQQTDTLTGSTSLMILPGYSFRMIRGMVTNFHQPGSTLLLLISAFLGDDWRKVYRYALENGFRFLSYGDACFFLRKP